MKDITGREYIYGLAQDKNGAPYLFNIGELVRCKDCKYAHMTYSGECKYCDMWENGEALYLDGDFFCKFGERKE